MTFEKDRTIKAYPLKNAPAYVRISDLSAADQEAFKKFLAATLRNAPVPPGENGPCAWANDYDDFARGADPAEGLIASERFLEKNKSRIKRILAVKAKDQEKLTK